MLTKKEILAALERDNDNRIKVYDCFDHRYIIGYDELNGVKYWEYCRDNSTGSFVPVASLTEAIKEVAPVRIGYTYKH